MRTHIARSDLLLLKVVTTITFVLYFGRLAIALPTPVHPLVSYEAGQMAGVPNEIREYLGSPDGYFGFTRVLNDTICEGSYDEDERKNPLAGAACVIYPPSILRWACDLQAEPFFGWGTHFWDPTTGPDWGYPDILTYTSYGLVVHLDINNEDRNAFRRAEELFHRAIALYKKGTLDSAYYELGRVAHLLEDMSTPAHVHLDLHFPYLVWLEQLLLGPDSYEDYIGDAYGTKDKFQAAFSVEGRQFVDTDAAGMSDYDPAGFEGNIRLYRLFYSMASKAKQWDSDEKDGLGGNGQGGGSLNYYDNSRKEYVISDTNCQRIANDLMNQALDHVAGLYVLFYNETHPTSPPPANAAPVLSQGNVRSVPDGAMDGTTAIVFEYTVSYGDPENDPAVGVWVVIKAMGTTERYAMARTSGTATEGTYMYRTNLPEGLHSYSFEAMDSHYNLVQTSTVMGPIVRVGLGSDLSAGAILDWDDRNPCDHDGCVESGEGAALRIRLTNNSNTSIHVFNATITSGTSGLDILHGDTPSFGYLAPGQSVWNSDPFGLLVNMAQPRNVQLTLKVEYMKGRSEFYQTWSLSDTLPQDCTVSLGIDRIEWSDMTGGDGDGIPESGESLTFSIWLQNTGSTQAIDVEATVTRPLVGQTDEGQWHSYPDIPVSDIVRENGSSPRFRVRRIPITFTGQLTADIIVKCAGNFDTLFADFPLFNVQPAAWLWLGPDRHPYEFGQRPTSESVHIPMTIENHGSRVMMVTSIDISPDEGISWTPQPYAWSLPELIYPGDQRYLDITLVGNNTPRHVEHSISVTVDADTRVVNRDTLLIKGLFADTPPKYQVPGARCDTLDVSHYQGGLVVWGWEDIYAYYVETGTQITVCSRPGSQSSPKACGPIVAWDDFRNAGVSSDIIDVYARPLEFYEGHLPWFEIPVATSPAPERLIGVGQAHTGDILIAFIRQYNSVLNLWDLYVYNVRTGSYDNLTNYSPPITVDWLHGYDFGGHLLTWRQECRVEPSYTSNFRQMLWGGVFPDELFVGDCFQIATNSGNIAWSRENSEGDSQIWLWHAGHVSLLTSEPKDHGDDVLAIGDDAIIYDKGFMDPLYGTVLSTGCVFAMPSTRGDCARLDGNLVGWRERGDPNVYYTFVNQPDLSVGPNSIQPSDLHPIEGDRIDVTIRVDNIAPWACGDDIVVRLYSGNPNEGGGQLGADAVIEGGIRALDSKSVIFRSIPLGLEGNMLLFCKIFPGCTDYAFNNIASKDLTIEDSDVRGPIIGLVCVSEHGGNDNGRIEPGEGILISWTARDGSGVAFSDCYFASDIIPGIPGPNNTYYVILESRPVGSYEFSIVAVDADTTPAQTVYRSWFAVFEPNECFPSDHADFDDWLVLGRPDCWCGPPYGSGYQLYGDIDGQTEGFLKYRVYMNDLRLLLDNWKKKTDDPTLDPCADIDHMEEGFLKYRVFMGDLNILVTNWRKTDSQLSSFLLDKP